MKKGMDYSHAHDLSCKKEIELRLKKVILPVGHHRQVTPWSCGPSALKIILDYYGNKINPKKIISSTQCTFEGTLHKGLRNMLFGLGYKFIEKENASLDDIEELILKGMPVMVDYQAYHGGHYSTIIGYDQNRFFISDPASDKKYKWINKQDFLKRWHEEDEPGKIVKKWLLAVLPT
jgi:ABC-type bacteriocin/lantibiotic exporter with double-glycine peptidase domain